MFHRFVPFVSISLRPFAPRALPRFVASMDALTPDRRLFGLVGMNTGLPVQVSLLAMFDLPTILSPPTPWISSSLSYVTPQRAELLRRALVAVLPSVSRRNLDFATWQQARQSIRPYRVCNRYGLVVHIKLLSTPSREDAGTLHYGPENACPRGTFTLPIKHHRRRTATGSSQCGVRKDCPTRLGRKHHFGKT